MLLLVFRCSRQLMIVSLSVHLSLQIGSFDFQHTQICTENLKSIVERTRLEDEMKAQQARRKNDEAERQESKLVEDYRTAQEAEIVRRKQEKKEACIAYWEEVL